MSRFIGHQDILVTNFQSSAMSFIFCNSFRHGFVGHYYLWFVQRTLRLSFNLFYVKMYISAIIGLFSYGRLNLSQHIVVWNL